MKNIPINSPRLGAVGPDKGAILDLWRETAGPGAIVDPSAVWLFFRRNFSRIALTSALTGALLFGAGFFLLKKYTASAVILVDPRSARVTQSGGVLANIGGDAIAIESLVQAARSEGALGELVEQLDLTRDPNFAAGGATPGLVRLNAIEKLASKLTIMRRGTTYVIDVIATSSSPEQAAQIANAAAKKLIEDQSRLRTGASSTAAREIESRLAELRSRVNRAEEAHADLKARLKVVDAGQGNTLLERRVFELNQQIVLAEARAAEARARYELLRRASAGRGDTLPQTAQSTVLASLRTEYARLSRQSADQSTVLGPRHPEVAGLKAQLADLRRQISVEIGRLMTAAHNDYLEAQQREATLSAELKSAQDESGRLGPELVKLGELEREAKAERAVYEQLLNRQRELAQVKDLEPSDIRIVSPALAPARTTPTRTVIAAGAAIIGLLTGLAYALLREMTSGALKTARQAERLGNVEVVGFLPLLARKDEAGAPTGFPDLTQWLGDLCAELKEKQRHDGGVALLVASANRGEGRSTVAANLATFLGEGGNQVLLVEADRPSGGGKRAAYGLLDVLESGEDLRGAFVELPEPGYTLLPFGGRNMRNHAVAPLMSGVTLRAMLKLARQWFDVVVIDGPPALEAQHARTLADQADETVFIVEWDKTASSDAAAAIARLDAERVAVVYNRVDPDRLRLYDPGRSLLMRKQAGVFDEAA